ncbi:unnamed protein product [Leptidea sinapis]|uniref:Uncharacterized protein n=1 Tax=Leptidea sinapis TaxID=189913 RepID=A0A5E4R5T2_9NEOP|nr:unnamed protein product [Leptidea sinapis]
MKQFIILEQVRLFTYIALLYLYDITMIKCPVIYRKANLGEVTAIIESLFTSIEAEGHRVTVAKKTMKFALILVIELVKCFCAVYCQKLILGTSYNNRIIFQEKVEYNAIPLKK